MRAHRSTLIFVNSRRLAERLAAALNELAGETLVRAHHGSLARAAAHRDRRPAEGGPAPRRWSRPRRSSSASTWARSTWSIQIEAPPSVASGMQRIGRAGHTSAQPSRGIIFPKYRGDLVACAAVTRAMHEAQVESTRYPRNPLDVLAQQIVAMVAMDAWDVDELFARGAPRGAVRRAEPRRSSTACSTCCRAAIRPTSSPSCGRASPGIA